MVDKETIFSVHKALLMYYRKQPMIIQTIIERWSDFFNEIGILKLFSFNDENLSLDVSLNTDIDMAAVKTQIRTIFSNTCMNVVTSKDFLSMSPEIESLIKSILGDSAQKGLDTLDAYIYHCISILDVTPNDQKYRSTIHNFKILFT